MNSTVIVELNGYLCDPRSETDTCIGHTDEILGCFWVREEATVWPNMFIIVYDGAVGSRVGGIDVLKYRFLRVHEQFYHSS